MNDARSVTLNNGVSLPLLGFGTYLIPDAQAAEAVRSAIGNGYRHIDTAEIYGNERGVGDGLKQGLADQGLRRDEVFVTTKLWPGGGSAAKSGRAVAASFDNSSCDPTST